MLCVATCSIGLFGTPADAADTSTDKALLGSPDFGPTPDKPVGWRGDWTGRFPGATPPTQWSRRVKGITSQISYQADKPAGEPGADSRQLEYFTIKEWLVAGPFAVQDPAAAMDTDFLGGEAKVEPAKGGKAGSAEQAWKPLRVGIDTQATHYHNEGTCGDLNVDFVYAFTDLPIGGMVPPPKGLDNKVAYAHTYVYAPAAGDVILRVSFRAAAIKAFLNGTPVPIKRDQPAKVSLQKGWNRLLVKVSSAEAAAPEGQNAWTSRWRFAAYLEPILPVSYETQNVAWMTKLTGRSMSEPIVVGDRIYLGSGMTDLMCIDKSTGRVRWLRSNTPYDGLTEARRAAVPGMKETIEPLVAKLNTLNDDTVKAINASVSPTGMSSDQQTALDKIVKTKTEAERAVHLAFRAVDKKLYPPMFENEVSASNSTPTSDGKFIYWVCGGGMKGPGAQVIACFDLDGKRIWSKYDASLGSPEHGNHISPTLVDGKLIYSARGSLMAYDVKTGEELWRNHPNDWQNEGHGSTSPVVVKVGGTSAIIEMRYVHRASDGAVICPTNLDIWGVLTPICENGIMYNPCYWRGWKDPVSFMAVKLPATAAPVPANYKPRIALDLPGKDVTMPIRMEGPLFMVASPLYVDGVVYSIEMGAGLAAVDTVAGKSLYRERLDGYDRYNRYLYGVCASPTLAGKNIYIVDDAGYTHIIQPGPKLVELNRNILENIDLSGLGGNPCKQECFYTSPSFQGKNMYLRGEEYLYCIRQN
jgi:outer membrane protein assembly factor BamB